MSLLIFGLGGPEILLIVILALLLFGGKKIPELMSGLGKGVKTFRDAMNGNDTQKVDGQNGQQPQQNAQQQTNSQSESK